MFDVGPKSLLIVCPPTPSSAVFVLPITIVPLSINRLTNNEFFFGWLFFDPGNPYVVLKPTTSVRSLIAIGNPFKGLSISLILSFSIASFMINSRSF